MLKAFILPDETMKEFNEFMKTHGKSCNAPTSIVFTFVNFETVITAECIGCGTMKVLHNDF